MSILFSHSKPNAFLIGYLSVGAALYLYATCCGLGLTFDSHHYLAAAQSLWQQGALRNADGTVYTNWPPLYPVFLAMFGANLAWIRIGQLLVFLGILFFCFQISQQAIQQSFIRFGFLTTILFGTPLLLVNVFVWSEGFFVLLLMASYISLQKYIIKSSPIEYILLILISAGMLLQRLAGLFFVLALGRLLWTNSGRYRALFYYIITTFPLALWIWRNTYFEDKPSFWVNVLTTPFSHNVVLYIEAIGNWLLPQSFLFFVNRQFYVLL